MRPESGRIYSTTCMSVSENQAEPKVENLAFFVSALFFWGGHPQTADKTMKFIPQ